jgi:predicted amidohydrolase YtcJ
MKRTFILLFLLLFCFVAKAQREVDMILANGLIYTMDARLSNGYYMAVHQGKVVAVSMMKDDIFSKFTSKQIIDLQGKFIYPGFNDAHCHFMGLGMMMMQADLRGAKSFDEVLALLKKYEQDALLKKKKIKWVQGRGWDQNIWVVKEFPSKEKLDSLFPGTPVILTRIDGHAALVNSKALKLAKIGSKTTADGGEIVRDANGKPTGLLLDNAMDLVERIIPKPTDTEMQEAMLDAQRICFSYGVTSVQDAGVDYFVIKKMESLQKEGLLKIKAYVMLNPTEENFKKIMSKGPYRNGNIHIQSVKLYADGALGSRGACLLEPYSDRPGYYGFMNKDTSYLRAMAKRVFAAGYQLNTHCIGDSASRVMLDIYGEILKQQNDFRWRIEHAQVIHQSDWIKLNLYSVIPSVQPTHVSSDKNWVPSRLGKTRLEEAYAYKSLLPYSGRLALGTDFPVEGVNPMATLYSAVMRTTIQEHPMGSFQIHNALTIWEALKGITYWASYAQFEEKEKGCLANGMAADFVILDMDIAKVLISDVVKAKVMATYLNGELVYSGN